MKLAKFFIMIILIFGMSTLVAGTEQIQTIASFTFDDIQHLTRDYSDLNQTAKALGASQWYKNELNGEGCLFIDNDPAKKPESQMIVYDHNSLDLKESFTIEFWFKLKSIGQNWDDYNGSPCIINKAGSRSPNYSNYSIRLERKDDRNILVCGFYNGRDWNEVKMGDTKNEPAIEVGKWYGLIYQYNSIENSAMLFVFDQSAASKGLSPQWDSHGLMFWEKVSVKGKPVVSDKLLMMGHSGGDEKNGWYDGCIDNFVMTKGIKSFAFINKLDLPRAPIQSLNLFAYQSDKASVTLKWQSPNNGDRYQIYRSMTPNFSIDKNLLIGQTKDVKFIDTKANERHIYYYRVGVVNKENVEYYVTDQISALLLPEIETVRMIPRASSVELNWEIPSPAYELKQIAGFNIYRREESKTQIDLATVKPIAILPNIVTYSDGGLATGKTYYYQIAARSMDGSLAMVSKPFGVTTDTRGNYAKFANIDMLTVIYTSTVGGRISNTEIDRIKNGFEVGREFIWRHSKNRLNLNISYLTIDDFKEDNFFPNDGNLWTDFVTEDFIAHGVLPNEYGMILCVYPPPTHGDNYSAMKILGDTGYLFIRYPFQEPYIYPAHAGGTDYGATWQFVRQVQHTLNGVVYNGQMWRADQMYDYSQLNGDGYDFMAAAFQAFTGYLNIAPQWGRALESEDNDLDGIPDADNRLPLDERRFDSNPGMVDSDGDGLTDMDEYMLGLYKSSDPKKIDTDGDSVSDKEDFYPLQVINTRIPQGKPDIDGQWDKKWNLILDDLYFAQNDRFKADIYANWASDGLYFAIVSTERAPIVLTFDFESDGWFNGDDNLQVMCDPKTDRNRAHVLDATPDARHYHRSFLGKDEPLWDDDPNYINWHGRLIKESNFQIVSQKYEDNFLTEIFIPKNDKIGLKPDSSYSFYFSLFFEGVNASAFEPYRFVKLYLN